MPVARCQPRPARHDAAGELADAQRRLRESDKPTYAGLGSRIEQLLRSAEEQSASVLSNGQRRGPTPS